MAIDADATDTQLKQPAGLNEGWALAETGPADAEETPDFDEPVDPALARPPRRHTLRPASAVLLIGVALTALVGWLSFRAHESHQRAEERAMYLAVARQGALNLTTISYTEVDADIQRILDVATGGFYDDFRKRSQPFVEAVNQAQSKSQGTITEAGLESVRGDHAQALVAVSVTTSNAAAAEQQPRVWRMRISVQKVGDKAKVSDVGFVP